MKWPRIITAVLIFLFVSGCTVIIKKTPPEEVRKAKQLKEQVEDLSAQVENLKQQKEQEVSQLVNAKKSLEQRLEQEIKDKQVRLELAERGLVITFVAEVLFDSGKAKIKPEAYGTLDKISKVLQEEVADRDIGIEGHTDNEPIKYSSWKSNWELSTARALSVLHYLVDNKSIEPGRVSARGYGEYRPVASNETGQGRQKNRRVEIIILPKITSPKVEVSDVQKIKEIEEKRIEEEKKYK